MGLLSFRAYHRHHDACDNPVDRLELRIALATLVALVVAGLIGSNYHFVSDTIGGLYLGAVIGLGTVALMLSPSDRLGWSSALSSKGPH
jgi:membrane-associated phospholipid phosphatase